MKSIIIAGRGLAAFTLAHTFSKRGVEVRIIGDPTLSSSSLVAGGLWNPVVLKGMVPSWKAEQLVPFLEKFYSEAEKDLFCKLITFRNFIRPFSEGQEIVLWKNRAAKELHTFLDPGICRDINAFPNCKMEMGYGRILRAGNLNVRSFIQNSERYFGEKVMTEKFRHGELKIFDDHVEYNGIRAGGIVFCEGWLIKNNPFFSYLPMKPVKGEVLEFSCSELKLKDTVISKGAFIMDTGENAFLAGATYDWNDLSETPDEKAKKELTGKLNGILSCSFIIKSQKAGIRPSTADRRPMLGRHPRHERLFVFNGLGTKGVMLAPYFAANFVNFVLGKEALDPEADISRFAQHWKN